MTSTTAQNGSRQLVRAIGRWSMVALTVNSVIGSGVFGLPSVVAGLIGRASVFAVLVGAAAVAVIMACFAEVASQFTETGGPYLYVKTAFGRLMGIEVAWLIWIVRLSACAANANLFVTYLGEFWPQAESTPAKLLILTLLIGALSAINYRGVRMGAQVSNAFTIAKLAVLSIVAFAGVFYLSTHHSVPAQHLSAGTGSWSQAIVLLIFAYGGFEAALISAGEVRDPRRDMAFGLFATLIICTVIYGLIQWVVVGVLPDPAHSARPLADVAQLILGRGGAAVVSLGALLSIYGYLSANTLSTPRITFALAEGGDFPAFLGAVHPAFKTPYVSILLYAALVWTLAAFGNFAGNVTLSAAARLLAYGLVCAAVPALRKKRPGAAGFRLHGGFAIPLLGILICVGLLLRMDFSKSVLLVITVVVAAVNWMVVRVRS